MAESLASSSFQGRYTNYLKQYFFPTKPLSDHQNTVVFAISSLSDVLLYPGRYALSSDIWCPALILQNQLLAILQRSRENR